MKTLQTLPKEQTAIIKKALEVYRDSLQKVNSDDDILQTEIFDTLVLQSLIGYKVNIELTAKEVKDFTSKNGVDFPEFSVKPIEISDRKCYIEVLRDEPNDRILYIERNHGGEIIGLNCMQGADDIEQFDFFKKNDEIMMKFYNEVSTNEEFKNMTEIEKVNKIIWLYFQARNVFQNL